MKSVAERLLMAFNEGNRKKFDRLCLSTGHRPNDVWNGLQKTEDDIDCYLNDLKNNI